MSYLDKNQEALNNHVAWEFFCDTSYFDQWAVREMGEKRWGHCFHVPSREEAEGLCLTLNKYETKVASLEKKGGEYKVVATILSPDPYEDRSGVFFSLKDSKALGELPANTSLYIQE